MKEPHNHAKVGHSMIVVSASLVAIGILALAIGSDVLFSDNISRDNTAHFEECKANDFRTDGCESTGTGSTTRYPEFTWIWTDDHDDDDDDDISEPV